MLSFKEHNLKFFENHQQRLKAAYPGLNAQILLKSLLRYSHKSEFDVYLNEGKNFYQQVLKGVPLEYILERVFFYKSEFYVDKRVLIPRDESEILVEDSVKFIKENDKQNFKAAEIGVGSFAVGLSVLQELDRPCFFWGGDISEDALAVSKINLYRYKHLMRNKKIELALSDRLNATQEKFDFIVSNPPYIPSHMRAKVHGQVDMFEPQIALYLESDEYDQWYRDLFKFVSDHLEFDGAFFMEGHEDCLEDLSELAKKYFSTVELKNDYTGACRFLHAYKR